MEIEVYAARQPIYDRWMNVYGYELLYRKSSNNVYEGDDDNQATTELIHHAFLVIQHGELTGGAKAFINFSSELLEKEIPLLLPKEKIVVEIVERVKPTQSIIRACYKLKEKGYLLALDDFVFDQSYLPLLEITDIIKLEFPTIDYDTQRQLIEEYKQRYNIQFLAEKIETEEEYRLALELGYDFFQGYFFSKPIMVRGKEITVLHSSVSKIMDELNQQEPDYDILAGLIERDLGLAYKLLKAVNSIFSSTEHKISSIKEALHFFEIEEIRKWMGYIVPKEEQQLNQRELLKTCLIRGKLMQLLAEELDMKDRESEFFITGIFSSIDTLIDKEMGAVVLELPLTDDVKQALLGKENMFRQCLDLVLCLEVANGKGLEHNLLSRVKKETVNSLYKKTLHWAGELDY